MAPRLHSLLLTTTALLALGSLPSAAGPNGANVVGGSATVSGQGSGNVVVNQSSNSAIINWQTFNIGAGQTTTFVQPNSSSVALNRVIGGLGPSEILGTLTANGKVFLVNRDGFLFGAGAVVNTASFLATTSDIKNEDFMAGKYNFNIPGNPSASIVNLGTITAANTGFAALVAPGVRNSGTITATLGTVALASGNAFTLDFYGDKLITLALGDQIASEVRDVQTGETLKSLVHNDGSLSANGGRVELTAAAARQVVDSVINNSGVVEANSVGTKNGLIVLGAATAGSKPAGAPKQTVKLAGKISAAGKDKGSKGGTVVVTGEDIQLTAAQIDVSGSAGGGKALIGGDWGGGTPDKSLVGNQSATLETYAIATATSVNMDATSTINASAVDSGNGGKVILWSDSQTTFAGTIFARGGADAGNGGFVETSSHGVLAFTGTVDLTALNGQTGTLLLDPYNVEICGDCGDDNISLVGDTFTPSATSYLSASTLVAALGSGNVVVTTGGAGSPGTDVGDINVNASINWNSNTTLTLSAYHDINVGQFVTIANGNSDHQGVSGNLVLRADNAGTGTGGVNFYCDNCSSRVDFRYSTGSVSIYYDPVVASGNKYASFNPADAAANVLTNVSAPNQLTAYMLVNSVSDLVQMQQSGSVIPTTSNYVIPGNFALGANIDATTGFSAANINGGAHFAGQFDGSGGLGPNYSISHLTLSGNFTPLGLFPFIDAGATVKNLDLKQVTITATGSIQSVGALAGDNSGTIVNVNAGGVVNGGTGSGITAGGLVGQNQGSISSSFADVAVSVGNSINNGNLNFAGGLAGYNSNSGSIVDSSAGGTVTGGASSIVGGLAGINEGWIGPTSDGSTFSLPPVTTTALTASCLGFVCATGDVHVGSLGMAGGLVGQNRGEIRYALATGTVTGDAGVSPSNNNNNNGNQTTLGGLAGQNEGLVSSSFAMGDVGTAGTAYLQAGGLVGHNNGRIRASFALGNVTTGDFSTAGGLTGDNGPHDHNVESCLPPQCTPPVGAQWNNQGLIDYSAAIGNVTVGNASLAGGLTGAADGTFQFTFAAGNVTGGHDSSLGGLVGGLGVGQGPSLIQESFALGSVTSTGPNSALGGLVGASGGTIQQSWSGGPVTGTSDSILGGLVGINVGLIQDASTLPTATVSATGSNNVVGGLVGLNFGFVDPSTSAGNVSSGPNSMVGSLIGANAAFVDNFNIPPTVTIAGSFPVGTTSADSIGSGTVNGGTTDPQIGNQFPTSGVPTFPSFLSTCDNGLCIILSSGQLTNPDGTSPSTTPPPDQQQQVIQNLIQDVILASLPGDVVNLQALTTPPRPPSTPGQPGQPNLPPQFGTRFFTPPPLDPSMFVQNEVVLQLPSNIPSAQLQAILSRLGLSVLGSQPVGLLGTTTYRLHIDNGRSVGAIIQALAQFQIVAGAQANLTYHTVQQPTAPASAPPSAPEQEGDAAQYIVGKLHLPTLHRLLKGTNVPIAVIDSQIDGTHPDLEGAIAESYDAVGAEDKPHPHGTGMAGAIASHRRVLGMAPGARIYAVHAFSNGPATAESTSFQILKGIDWAASHGVRVINMSFAGPRDPSLERALKTAYDKGVVLIAAAGNAGPKSPPLYPAADPHVIAVTATDVNDKLFTGANRGKHIAVAAPGVDILVPAPESSYQLTTGTSVAAAEVSGIVALMLERNPKLTPADVRRILMASATRLGPTDRNDDYGSGLIDPTKAVESATVPRTAEQQAPAAR